MSQTGGDRLVLELPDGGSLGFAEFGDPDGVPCVAFHGLSSSRLMPGWMFPPESLAAARVRMIGVDRPGYGLSTVPWVTGFPYWPRAVTTLADHLGLAGSPCWPIPLDRRSRWPAGPPCTIGSPSS